MVTKRTFTISRKMYNVRENDDSFSSVLEKVVITRCSL